MASAEIELAGGRTTTGIVRVGNTVRRPLGSRSRFIHRLLQHLEAKRFEGAPRFLGLDDRGREVLTFVPGDVPRELGYFSEVQFTAAARLLRSLHDATGDSGLRADSEIVCHGDPSPCNCVFMDGMPRAFIDFDAAHPGARADDLGYAAWHWLDVGSDDYAPAEQGRRLASFFAAYDAFIDWDPVDLVIQAMKRQSARPDGPPGNREWARACLAWVRVNRSRVGRAA